MEGAVFAHYAAREILPRIETTCDPLEGGKYRPRWEVFEGGVAGAVSEITGLRVVITHLEGWAELMVETQTKDGA